MDALNKRYAALIAAKDDYPSIPANLYAALSVTAANALYLHQESMRVNDLGILRASLRLFDTADEILKQWLDDPETWLTAPQEGTPT